MSININILIPSGLKLNLTEVGKETISYKIYTEGTKLLFEGKFKITPKVDYKTDKFVLDFLGSLLYASYWTAREFKVEIINPKEFSDKQMDWLGSDHSNDLLDMLEDYEEDNFDPDSGNVQVLGWAKGKLVNLETGEYLIRNLNLN